MKIKLNCSLDEMIKEYLKSTNKVSLDKEVKILYEEDKGFVTYIHTGDTLMVPDVYGNGLYWLVKMEELAKSLHCTRLLGGTTRNVKAYNKMFGTKIIGYILEKEIVWG